MEYCGREVDVDRVLKALGINGIRSGNNIYSTCPLHQDRSPSFSFNIDRGLYICFANCSPPGNLEQLVSKILGLSTLKAGQWIIENSNVTVIQLEDIFGDDLLEEEEAIAEVIDDESMVSGHLPQWFRDRGFDDSDIERWDLRFEAKTGAVIIPLTQGFIRRWPPGSKYRYQYSAGCDKKSQLFGFINLVKQVNPQKINYLLVTEGSLDAMKAIKYGYDAVAILGSHISNEQIRKISLLNPKEVVLAFDNDETGVEVTESSVQKLDKFRVSILEIPKPAKDICDLTKETLDNIFEQKIDSTLYQFER